MTAKIDAKVKEIIIPFSKFFNKMSLDKKMKSHENDEIFGEILRKEFLN